MKALRTIAKGLGRDRRENVDLKKMSDTAEGSVCTLEQRMGAPSRIVSMKPVLGKAERTGRIVDKTAVCRQ